MLQMLLYMSLTLTLLQVLLYMSLTLLQVRALLVSKTYATREDLSRALAQAQQQKQVLNCAKNMQ